MSFDGNDSVLERFDTRQIVSRRPAGGRRAGRAPARADAPRFTSIGLLYTFPCSTASRLMNNEPKNAARRRFQIGPRHVATPKIFVQFFR